MGDTGSGSGGTLGLLREAAPPCYLSQGVRWGVSFQPGVPPDPAGIAWPVSAWSCRTVSGA